MKIFRSYARPIAMVVIVMMTAVSVPVGPAYAVLVGTDTVISDSGAAMERISAFLERADVVAELEALGVSPDEARARIAALSDAELNRIAGKIDSLPAGEGILGAVLGAALIVFIVLLITDLLGATDVFSFTNKGSMNPK